MNEEKRLYYLDQMGIQAWIPQTNIGTSQVVEEVIAEGVIEKELNFEQTSQQKITSANLDELKLTVSNCTQCELHRTRTQTVFGVGHPAAEWLIIGEAPGADEDRLGEPFVGRAGQLLTSMLRSMGLAREEVFIANILKCRPPNNR
ncbi:MAG: uracil-DNA glycosylase, partial [Gammaproteobacteria bacterium]|nr:uracil-DNA glycosylase [Gammaproteobacteria bacterium]